MKFIDLHCDTLMRLYDLENQPGGTSETLWHNCGQIDLTRLCQSGYAAQFFACFLWFEGKPVKGSFYEDALAMADLLHTALLQHTDLAAFAGSYQDYLENQKNGRLSAFLTVEEGGILDGDLSRLDQLYEKGVRLITLTWNCENCLGYPNFQFQFQNNGLKAFGVEALRRMDELGIIADVSHLSDGGFWDVVRYGKRPFLASHSNARSVMYHARNLTDEMIKAIAEKGGVIGLNFGGDFLQENGKSTVEALVRHARHLLSVGGPEILAIGTDFDGVEDRLEISDCSKMPDFAQALEKNGFSVSEIEGICFRNAELFLKRYFGGTVQPCKN